MDLVARVKGVGTDGAREASRIDNPEERRGCSGVLRRAIGAREIVDSTLETHVVLVIVECLFPNFSELFRSCPRDGSCGPSSSGSGSGFRPSVVECGRYAVRPRFPLFQNISWVRV